MLSLNKNLRLLLFFILYTCPVFPQQSKITIYFSEGNSALSKTARARLDSLIKTINDKTHTMLTIAGYADSKGDEANNLSLSEKRAQSTKAYFVVQGFEKNNLSLKFYGESNNSGAQWQNRRAELFIDAKKTGTQNKPRITEKRQHFRVSANKINNEGILLYGKLGTTIGISKSTLCIQNGMPVKTDVDFELTEFYKKSDMVLADLSTVSDEGIFETAGIVYISASSLGEQLKLKEGSGIMISFATKRKEGMKSFNSDGIGNHWKQEIATGLKKLSIEQAQDSTWHKRLENITLLGSSLGWLSGGCTIKEYGKGYLIVETDTSYTPTVYLVFKSTNCVVAAQRRDGKFIFEKLPIGQKANLVAFSIIKGQSYLTMKEITIREQQNESLSLLKMPLPVLMTELKKLD